jgi:hypothetical protein
MASVDDLDAAWDALHGSMPPGWVVGRPMYHDEAQLWEQYAFRPPERRKDGKGRDEWTAIAATEAECVRKMARCLNEISAGRWPA